MSKKIVNIEQPMIGLFPLPVALVTCISNEGKPNIIPLGWVGGVCSEPPQVGIAIRPSRYSYSLIKDTKEFVVNIPTEEIIRKVDWCGFVSGVDTDKFKETNLTPVQGNKVKVPLIHECPVNLECVLRHLIPLGSHGLFIGEILCVNADEDLVNKKGQIDFSRIKPVVLHWYDYFGLGNSFGYYGFSVNNKRKVW